MAVPAEEVDLVERVRLIVEVWGGGEGLEGERVAEIAGNLYGAGSEEVSDAIIENLRVGRIRGRFYAVDPLRSSS